MAVDENGKIVIDIKSELPYFHTVKFKQLKINVMFTKENITLFAIVVVAVIAAAWISGKLKLNSYEEYYEQAA